MKVVALSGWGQPYDALAELLPQAIHVDYARNASLPQALALIAREAEGADLLVGWSMGGQMAVRALAAGLRVKRLALFGTPFQFVADAHCEAGMGADTFAQYRTNLVANPARTFKKSYALVTHGDLSAKALDASRVPDYDWLHWLDTMAGYSARGLDFTPFPPTLLIHGENDVVVAPAHAALYANHLPHATAHILPGCGHAPHWHDVEKVRSLLEAHV